MFVEDFVFLELKNRKGIIFHTKVSDYIRILYLIIVVVDCLLNSSNYSVHLQSDFTLVPLKKKRSCRLSVVNLKKKKNRILGIVV